MRNVVIIIVLAALGWFVYTTAEEKGWLDQGAKMTKELEEKK